AVPIALVAAAAVAALLAAGAPGHPIAGAPACPIFPRSNQWNQRVDKLPVAKNSAAIVKSIGRDTGLHPDFGSGLYQGSRIGIPYTSVSGGQPKVHVKFHYAS